MKKSGNLACRFSLIPGELLVWFDSVCFHFQTISESLYVLEGCLSLLRTEVLSPVHYVVLSRYALTVYDKKGPNIFPEMVIPLDEVVHLKHEPSDHEGYIRITLGSGKKYYLGRAEEGLPLITWFQNIQCGILVAKHQRDHEQLHCLQLSLQFVVDITHTSDSISISHKEKPLGTPDAERARESDKFRPTKFVFQSFPNAEDAFVMLTTAWKSWTPETIKTACCLATPDMQPRDPFFQNFRVRVHSAVREYDCHLGTKISHGGSLYVSNEFLGFRAKGKAAKHLVLAKLEHIRELKVEKHFFKTQLCIYTVSGEVLHFQFDDEDERMDCMNYLALRVRKPPVISEKAATS